MCEKEQGAHRLGVPALLSGGTGKVFNEELNPAGQRAEILFAPVATSGSSGCLTLLKARRNGPKAPSRSLSPS